jgi:hypothetical protein
VFIHVLFNFVDHSYIHSFEFYVGVFILFTILNAKYYEVVDFWRYNFALFFHISCLSALGFVHLRPSHLLEVLMTFSLSVEMFPMFRQNGVVAELWYSFSPVDWGW